MKKKILIIDDDRELCGEMAGFLRDEGYAVATAPDGSAGLARAARGGYGLVILDLKLPGVNGLDLLTRLRRGGNATPVIVLSGSPLVASSDADSGKPASAADRRALRLAVAVIPKPFDVDSLLLLIRDLLG